VHKARATANQDEGAATRSQSHERHVKLPLNGLMIEILAINSMLATGLGGIRQPGLQLYAPAMLLDGRWRAETERAKAILSLFGVISVFLGLATIVAALFLRYRGWDLAIALGTGCGMLMAAGPLLGMAEIIHLLERIAANTEGGRTFHQRIEPTYTLDGQRVG
jgi:hypothetical protein